MRSRPNPRFIEPLLRILGDIHPEDNHLAHTLRIALAAHCQSADDIAQLRELRIPKDSWPELLKVIIASEHTSGADFLLDALADKHLNAQQLQPALSYLASHTDIARIDILRPLILAHPSQDDQFAAFAALIQGLARRNIGYQAALKNWVVDLVGPVLVTPPDTPWTFSGEHNSFGLRSRNCEDGVKTEFFDSIVGGETHTGRMRSAAFAIPATLSFWMCGHNGQPGSNPPEHNHVRLVLAESGETIAQALPPRHDTARRFSWDLAEHVGKQAHFEIIDGQTFTGFAWLAVARFEPPVITVPKDLRRISRERQVQAIEWVESFGILDFSAEIEAIAADAATPGDLRVAASSYLIKHAPDKAQGPIQAIFAGAGRADQERLATMLSGSPAGAELLFTLIEEGKASARLLQMPGLAARLRDDARIASLTQDLQPLEAHLAKLLAERQKGFASATRSAEKGAVIFDTHCTACHQLGGQGARIGPGLDGIGNRGAERLLEDILDPNRNVDAAFHPAVITLKSGDVLSGLLSEEDDGILTLTDMVGKAHPIPIANIASKAVSKLSLMPPTYGELLSAQQLYDLVEFLRSR
jgi:putative heme-binding domain-containing protein